MSSETYLLVAAKKVNHNERRAMSSPEVFPFGKHKGRPVEVAAADTGYCEWLTTQKWFRGKYRDLYKALRDHGAEPQDPAASTTPPVPVFVGTTGTENMTPETAEYWPPWEEPPVPGCLAESGIPVTGLVWCPVHEEHEELCDGVPAVRLEYMLRAERHPDDPDKPAEQE